MRKLAFYVIIAAAFLSSCKPEIERSSFTKISPYIYGQNLWLTQGSEGRKGYIQNGLWPKIKDSGVKIVRIGGNGYDRSMPSMDTLTLWVKSIKSIGAEPFLQVSKYKSSHEAAELVKYFNIENNLQIKYWSISNEPYFKGEFTIDSISKYIKTHASAMKAVDPDIKIFAPDAASYYPELYEKLLMDNNLSIAGRDEYGHWYIDGISFHNYPNGKEYTRSDVIFKSVSKIRGMMMQLKHDIDKANTKYNREGADRLIWGLTEFNITYRNPDLMKVEGIAVPSFINGQFWAEVFGLCMEYGAFTATPWCIQESDRQSTYFGYIGGPPEFNLHSTYYHMQILSDYISGQFFKIKIMSPYLKGFGAETKDGYSILLMNQNASISYSFSFDNAVKNNPKQHTHIELPQGLKLSLADTIEANTTLLISFNKQGKLKKVLTYNLDLASKNKPPFIK